jgi:hypothetical protein
VYGGAILSRIPVLAFAASTARWHHERWDGLGYPDRLVGHAIPLFARIVAVAETHIPADILRGSQELAQQVGAHVYVSGAGGDDWQSKWVKPFKHSCSNKDTMFCLWSVTLAAKLKSNLC